MVPLQRFAGASRGLVISRSWTLGEMVGRKRATSNPPTIGSWRDAHKKRKEGMVKVKVCERVLRRNHVTMAAGGIQIG